MSNEKKSFKKIAKKTRALKAVPKKTPTPKTASKKATKTTKKSKLFSKAREEKKELTLDLITQLIKDNETLQAVELLLKGIENADDIVGCFVAFINKSNFRAYSLALKKFNFVLHDYKKSKSKELLTAYLKTLGNEMGKERFYSEFTDIRMDVIKYLAGLPVNLVETAEAMSSTLSGEYDENFNKRRVANDIDFICLLADKKWPDKAKGLRLLYGNK